MPFTSSPHYLVGNTVPPKKSYSWRSDRASGERQNSALQLGNRDSSFVTASGGYLPATMRPNKFVSPGSQNENHVDRSSQEENSPEDNPLDFSLKNNSRSRSPSSVPNPSEMKPKRTDLNNFYCAPNGSSKYSGGPLSWSRVQPQAAVSPAEAPQCNGDSMTWNGLPPRVSTSTCAYKVTESAVSPVSENNGFSQVEKTGEVPKEPESRSPAAEDLSSLQSPPRPTSPNIAKTPILAGMLTKNAPSSYPVDAYKAYLMHSQRGYPNGHASLYVNIPGASLGFPDGLNYSPSDMGFQQPGLALMAAKMNPFPAFQFSSTPGKFESKATGVRKANERPFKAYNPNLEADFPFGLFPYPSPIHALSPPGFLSNESRVAPYHPNDNSSMSLSPNSSQHSDNLPSASEVPDSNQNGPHSNVPDRSPNGETAEANGRKRKAVADSEKDENYYKRREKNNAAAKRSREARRRKEDAIAKHAMFYRDQCKELVEAVKANVLRAEELTRRCATLEQAQLNLLAENKLLNQQLRQKRCEKCGIKLAD